MKIFEKLSSIYSQMIAKTIAVAPADWARLWIRTECGEGSWSIGGYWERRDIEDVIFFHVPDEVGWLLYESWKVSRDNKDEWSTALFRVDRPDILQITFGHEDLDDDSYSPFDSQASFRTEKFGNRKIDDSSIDMSGAISLTPQMLHSGSIGPQAG